MEIGLVSCTSDKLDEPAPPGDLYTASAYFRKMRQYAEAHHARWYVLSAKHGLLEPHGTPIEPYDASLYDRSAAERRAWAEDVFEALAAREPLDGDQRVVLHAGRVYYEELLPHLDGTGVSVEIPTEGLAIGETMQWYDEHS